MDNSFGHCEDPYLNVALLNEVDFVGKRASEDEAPRLSNQIGSNRELLVNA